MADDFLEVSRPYSVYWWHDCETVTPKWNESITSGINYSHVFPLMTCRNVCCGKGQLLLEQFIPHKC